MEQIELIRHAVRTLDALAVPYALVGSWGSGLYGEPRFTRDESSRPPRTIKAAILGVKANMQAPSYAIAETKTS